MTTSIEAVYEHGVLRPTAPIDLAEGTRVDLIMVPRQSTPDPRTAARILAEIAALPLEGEDDGFSGRDHDRVLYGARESHGV